MANQANIHLNKHVSTIKLTIDRTNLIEVTIKTEPINYYFETSESSNRTGNH